MESNEIQQILKTIPHMPGVYQYFNSSGEIIYVGKAKDLRKRVASYFSKKSENQKTRNLVKNIDHIKFIVVDTERDALLLENSLIKNHRPRYNVSLKDDKSYPYIVIKNEPFPRVFLTHKVVLDGSEHFGPFTNVGRAKKLLELIRDIVPLRRNSTDLFLRITKKGNIKVSPEYYTDDRRGKDAQILTEDDYEKGLQQVRDILNGKMIPLIVLLRKKMKGYVGNLQFEKAEELLQELKFLREYKTISIVVNMKMADLDVFNIIVKDSTAFFNYLKVRKGAIVRTRTIPLKMALDSLREELLVSLIVRIQKEIKNVAYELVVPFPIDYPDPKFTITVPKKGDKKKLLDLSTKNLIYYSEQANKVTETTDK